MHDSEALGVNLLDTAEAYGNGHGEAVVGEALQGRRHKWIIATKVRPNQGIDATTPDAAAVRKRITEACEQSLQRLRTDYIDLYQLHAIPYPWAMPIAMETLDFKPEILAGPLQFGKDRRDAARSGFVVKYDGKTQKMMPGVYSWNGQAGL